MADRIGVISKGELILVEDKAELMRKLGKKQLTLQLQQPLARGAGRARRATRLELSDGRHRADLHLRHPGRAHRHRRAAATTSATPASSSRTCRPTQSSLEDIFVSLVQSDDAHEHRTRSARSTASRWRAPAAR